MAIIDPKGMFHGERLAACSDAAQNYWPRLFLAANGFARLELSYSAIVDECFRSYRRKPSEDDLWAVFEEYARNYLVILYQVDGIWWAEFATSQKYLPKYKTRRDELSPTPTQEARKAFLAGYLEWKKAKSIQNQRFQKFAENSEKVSKVSHGIGIGIGIGEEKDVSSDADASSLQQASPPEPILVSLPLKDGTEFDVTAAMIAEWSVLYPAVDVAQQCRSMRGWCIGNPKNLKTRAGIKAFIVRWLGKEQNHAPAKRPIAAPETSGLPSMQYSDPASLYDGPEYQPKARQA